MKYLYPKNLKSKANLWLWGMKDFAVLCVAALVSVLALGSYAFYGCSGLTSITIPDSVTSIGGSAFNNCRGLMSVVIGNGVEGIGSDAFNSCTSLTSITIHDSVTSIDNYAFSGCSNLTDINYNGSMEEWNKIVKAESWNSATGNYVVHCTDGDIKKS